MVESIARVRHIRVTPQKARRVVALIKGKQAQEALAILKFAPQSASEPIYKLVASAIANARVKADKDGEYLDEQDLYVKPTRTWTRARRSSVSSPAPRVAHSRSRSARATSRSCSQRLRWPTPPRQPRPRRRASNGPEGKPVRLPPRHHHRPRVALVLRLDEARTALRRLRGRGHQDPSSSCSRPRSTARASATSRSSARVTASASTSTPPARAS